MKFRSLLPVLLAAPMACAAAAPLSAWRATPDAVGPIRLGMTLDEVRRAAGLEFIEQPQSGEVLYWESCHYAWAAAAGQLRLDLALVIRNGRVARVDVATAQIPTASGARVGDSEASVRTLYSGRLQVEADPDAAEGKRLVLYPQRPQQLLFVIEGDKVAAYRVGLAAAVRPAGGCA